MDVIATKNIYDVNIDRAPILRTVKKLFNRFYNDDCKVNDESFYERTSDNYNDLICDLVNNYPLITTEGIAVRLYIDNLIAFCT